MCIELSHLIETLTEIHTANGDMTVEIATGPEGLDFSGIGGFSLDSCDCCGDDLLTIHPCEDDEVDSSQGSAEVTYMPFNLFKGFGHLN